MKWTLEIADHDFYFSCDDEGSKGLLGDRPVLSATAAATLYPAAAAIHYFLLSPGITDPVLSAAIPLYICWLTTTVWRAAATQRLTMFAGSLLFMVSDCLIGLNMFHGAVPRAQVMLHPHCQPVMCCCRNGSCRPTRSGSS